MSPFKTTKVLILSLLKKGQKTLDFNPRQSKQETLYTSNLSNINQTITTHKAANFTTTVTDVLRPFFKIKSNKFKFYNAFARTVFHCNHSGSLLHQGEEGNFDSCTHLTADVSVLLDKLKKVLCLNIAVPVLVTSIENRFQMLDCFVADLHFAVFLNIANLTRTETSPL